MPTSYPAALDNFTNPTASDAKNSATVPHASQHANVNDAIEAIEALVGRTGNPWPGGLNVVGQTSKFGLGAVGGTGGYIHIEGDTTNAYVIALGSMTNVPLILRSKGTGLIQMQDGDSSSLFQAKPRGSVGNSKSSMSTFWKTSGGVGRYDDIEVGATDSGGSGFRLLRVPN